MSMALPSLDIISSDKGKQTVPKYIERKLKRDAARLAIRMIAQGEDLSLIQVEVPKKEAKEIYDVLVSIYNSKLDKAEEIFNIDMRVATNIPIDKFWLIYEKDADWASELKNGETEVSGDIEDLIDEYDLFISDPKNWDEEHGVITINSVSLYNMTALAQKFTSISGVSQIHTHDPDIAPDFDIDIKKTGNVWEVSFTETWSSINGPKSHTWKFNVTSDASNKVEFLEEFGDDPPLWRRK